MEIWAHFGIGVMEFSDHYRDRNRKRSERGSLLEATSRMRSQFNDAIRQLNKKQLIIADETMLLLSWSPVTLNGRARQSMQEFNQPLKRPISIYLSIYNNDILVVAALAVWRQTSTGAIMPATEPRLTSDLSTPTAPSPSPPPPLTLPGSSATGWGQG